MTTWNEDDVAACLKVMDPEDDQTGGGTAAAVAGVVEEAYRKVAPKTLIRQLDAEK